MSSMAAAATYVNVTMSSADEEDEGASLSSAAAVARPVRPPRAHELTTASGAEPPPDRIIYVGDDGLVDTADDGVYDSVEVLTAEFRHRLGLLPDEEQELSAVFKASIGLTTFDYDRLERLVKDKQGTVENYAFQKFASKYFRNGIQPRYSAQKIVKPLLQMKDETNKKAVPLINEAIRRFMESTPKELTNTERPRSSVMSAVCLQLKPKPSSSSSRGSVSSSASSQDVVGLDTESNIDGESIPTTPNTPNKKSKLSIKKLLRLPSSDKSSSKKSGSVRKSSVESGSPTESLAGVHGMNGDGGGGAEESSYVPTSELDLVHYVIAHAILKPSLRDEILCQLCCQVTDNPSTSHRERGWMLLALCAGCFLPSNHLLNYYFGFLHEAPEDMRDFARYIMVMIRRTNANGARYHPPSWVELQAVKLRKYPVMQVGVPDGRVIPVESDPATSAWEICLNIANTIGLRDHFGFSIYVGVHRKISSLGSGSDHVMDAISECEQMLRVEEGLSEESSPWRIYYQKEIFTPWHDPATDRESTTLIYRQIIDGIRRGEYPLLLDEVPKVAARIFYIEHGPEVDLNMIKSKMETYFPKALLASAKSRDSLAKSIMSAFETRGYSAGLLNDSQVKDQVVSIATNIWPLNFSAMFEALRHSGPPLPCHEVVLAVNGEGVFILDGHFKTILGFHYYDIVDAMSTSARETKRPTVRFITLDGAEFSFFCPNSTTVYKIISVFLDGLRRRSRWAVALQSFQLQDYTGGSGPDFRLRQGDIVELKDESSHTLLHADWLYGRCERTKVDGSFPYDVVYVLPTAERPDDKFLSLFGSMGQTQMSTLPRKRNSGLILSSGTTGRHEAYGIESSA